MTIRGTHRDDNLTGNSGDDNFILSQGGNDTVSGGDGNDVFRFGNALTAADRIDGGNDKDTVILNGDYSSGLVFAADTMVNVETLSVVGNFDYSLTSDDATVAAGQSLVVKANGLGAGHSLTFDGSAETDGHFRFVGSTGGDALTGGAKADLFHLENGGSDTAQGGAGGDTFLLGTSLWSDDRIDGGMGNDTVHVDGFAGGNAITFTSTTMQHVEDFIIDSSFGLQVTTDDATVAAGATMTFDNSATSGAFMFDGSAETDGHFVLIGGAGDDMLTGGAQSDTFDVTQGGNDAANGGGGDDTIHFGVLTIDDSINGGTGDDTLTITGDVGSDTLVLNPGTLTNIDHLIVAADARIEIALDDATVAAGQTMIFDGSAVATQRFSIDGELETDGHLDITGGGAYGILVGGALSDTITTSAHTSWYEAVGLGGADAINLNSGEDDVIYQDVSDSTGTVHDVDSGFDAGEDNFFFFGTTVGGFDGVLTGSVSAATLDGELHGITSGALGAGHAWEVDVTSGDLSGHEFLVVDVNGDAQYDGGSDYLIDISGHTGTISMANFI